MFRISISEDAISDLNSGFKFYEAQEAGLGDYFLSHVRADIDRLKVTAGVHRRPYRDLHRCLCTKFPYAVFYQFDGERALVVAVLDCRRAPEWIRSRLCQ